MAVAAPATSSLDADRAIGTLLVAFAADPIVRWFLPAPSRYAHAFPQTVRLMGGGGFAAGTVDLVDDEAGAAVWVPPGGATEDEDALVAHFEASVDPGRHDDAFAFIEQMEAHHPTGPHWYLPFIGVDPRRQGQGHGAALLARGLARCDRDGLPAYLEASSPRNRGLYERHGFEAFAEIQVADSPPMWPMLRPAN